MINASAIILLLFFHENITIIKSIFNIIIKIYKPTTVISEY
jgi:hypothetical protein